MTSAGMGYCLANLDCHAIPNIKRGDAAGFTEFGLERFEAIGTAPGYDYLGSRTNEAAACSFADPRSGSGHERSELDRASRFLRYLWASLGGATFVRHLA